MSDFLGGGDFLLELFQPFDCFVTDSGDKIARAEPLDSPRAVLRDFSDHNPFCSLG